MTSDAIVAALHLPPVAWDKGPMPEIATPYLEHAARAGAQLVLLPELFAWPFYCCDAPERWRHGCELLDGPSVQWAQQNADRLGVTLLVPFPHKATDGTVRNSVALVKPNTAPQIIADKMHLPPHAENAYGEQDHFVLGAPHLRTFCVTGLKVAVGICFDRRFPATWEAARRAGADLLCIPVSGPSDDPADFFIAELRTHARETGLCALSAGRTGRETPPDGQVLVHDAPSALVDADGRVVMCLAAGAPAGVVTGNINRATIELARLQRPHFEMRHKITGDAAQTERL